MTTETKYTPGPCETLARLTLQTNEYHNSPELKEAVDNVLGNPLFDAAPDLLEACRKALIHCLPFQLSEFADISVIQTLRYAINCAERGADEGGI